MTSDLAWIIRACLFVCLWRACLCNKPDCPYNEYLKDMVEGLPNDYLFRVNKSEETIERVAKSLSWFYGNNCKKDYKCEDYTDEKTTAVCYLLGCLHKENQNPECVSSVTYCLAEVELVSLKGFKCLVKDAFNQKKSSQKQDEECADVFVDAVTCQKATTLDTNPPTMYTTTLPTINYKTSSILPKTSSSTTPPPSSLTSSTISNNDDMESQEQRLQSKVISVSTLLAISLIANILLLGFVILRTRGRRQNEGVFPAMPELTLLNAVEVHNLMQNNNGDALQY